VIIKGLKGDFLPVTEWYKEVLANLETLFKIIEKPDEGWTTVMHLLDIFKAGFYSKQAEVALWTCKLLAQFASELNNKGLSGPSWDWFITGSTSGLQGLLYCFYKTHAVPTETAIAVLCQFGKYNYAELFTHYLKQVYTEPKDYMLSISGLINALAEYKPSKDEIIGAGILQYWIDLGTSKADYDPNAKIEERSAALILLFEIWLNFPSVVEEKAEYADTIIKLSQRANRDKNEVLQLSSLAMLFRLLDVFASEKNPYAPIVYKTLTFALVENHQKTIIREFILNNFKLVFTNFPSIPPSIVLEPFIKQIRRSDGITFFYNLFDFEFFIALGDHPKLNTKSAIQVLDLLAKTYLYDELFANCAMIPFSRISERFKEDPTYESFILKLLRFALNVYSSNVKKLRKSDVQASVKYLKYIGAKVEDDKSSMLLQNDRIINLINRTIYINIQEISNKLGMLLLEENIHMKLSTKQDDETLLNIVEKIPNSDAILKEFESAQKAILGGSNDKKYSSPKRAKPLEKFRKISSKGANIEHDKTQDIINNSESYHAGDRSVLSEREERQDLDLAKKVPYPKEYSIVPYKKITVREERAIKEIERIKQKKEEREEKKRIEENRKKIEEAKKKKVLQKQLEIRKIEHGILPSVNF